MHYSLLNCGKRCIHCINKNAIWLSVHAVNTKTEGGMRQKVPTDMIN